MAGIKQPIQDICTKLREILVANGEGQNVNAYVRIWNNHVRYEDSGELYNFPKPAIFVEILNDVSYQALGMGVQSADLVARIHIVYEQYDAQDGTFEQDLNVFDLRDKVVKKLHRYEPTACGPLVRVNEEQDFEHTSIYHYVVDFVCHFIDSKGSTLDENAGVYIEKAPPTDLEVVAEVETAITGTVNILHNHNYNIPQ